MPRGETSLRHCSLDQFVAISHEIGTPGLVPIGEFRARGFGLRYLMAPGRFPVEYVRPAPLASATHVKLKEA